MKWRASEVAPLSRGGARLRMGLSSVPDELWLDRGPGLRSRIEEKARIFARCPEAVLALPGSEAAAAELAALLGVPGGSLIDAALTVAEDLCLIEMLGPDGDGRSHADPGARSPTRRNRPGSRAQPGPVPLSPTSRALGPALPDGHGATHTRAKEPGGPGPLSPPGGTPGLAMPDVEADGRGATHTRAEEPAGSRAKSPAGTVTPNAASRPVLTAGALAFPTDWTLKTMLGRELRDVHAAVPGYAAALSASVDSFLTRLPPGRIHSRSNWFIVETAALRYLPERPAADRFDHVTAANAGGTLFLRTERQTFRRLPSTGAVVFAIGIYLEPLAALSPDLLTTLLGLVRSLSPAEARRLGSPGYLEALAGYAQARRRGRITQATV